jgi:hypothetical protein
MLLAIAAALIARADPPADCCTIRRNFRPIHMILQAMAGVHRAPLPHLL